MLYNGYFRSTDTSIDPKGQLYKVVIFTGISSEGYYPSLGRMPIFAKELLLTDEPFVVEYSNDSSNVYKPYKCSTATVGIMLDQLDTNLISIKKNDIMVYLLKQKNTIVERGSGSVRHLLNTATGTELRVVLGQDPSGRMSYDYDPRSVDKFAYDVEWVGYATPNTYNQNYVRVLEPYSLECQDAFSSLRYYDFKRTTNSVTSFHDILINCLKQIDGVYNHIYVSDSTFCPDYGLWQDSVLKELFCNEDNWIDEDGQPMNCLAVLEEIFKYLTLTIIPYKDALYITNPDAIINHSKRYYRYDYNDTTLRQQIFIPRGISRSNESEGFIELGSDIDFNSMNISKNDTSLSLTDTYRRVKVVTNEYYYDEVSANIDDDEQFERIASSDWDQFNSIHEVSEVHQKNNTTVWYEYKVIQVHNSGSILSPKSGVDVSFKNYGLDYNSNYQRHVNTTQVAAPTTWSGIQNSCGCTAVEIDASRVELSTVLTDIHKSYNGSRMYLFHTPAIKKSQTEGGGSNVTPVRYPATWFNGNQPLYAQPMLTIKTTPAFLSSRQCIQLTGDWTFYNTRYIPFPTKWDTSVNDNLFAYPEMMYVWAKICVRDSDGNALSWLANSTSSTGVNYGYTWTQTEQWVKLWYGGIGWGDVNSKSRGMWWWKDTVSASSQSAFETTFSFIKNNRAVDGTVIQLPTTCYGQVEITFNRPVGCAMEWAEGTLNPNERWMYFAQTTTLENLSVNYIDIKDLDYRHEAGDEERDRSNGSYTVEMTNWATDDYSNVGLKLSSGLDKATNKSLVWYMHPIFETLDTPVRITNKALQITGYPENNLARSIAGTYKVPRMIMNQSLHLGIDQTHPLNIYTWQTQFGGAKYLIDNMSIDYRNDSCSVELLQKGWDSPDQLTKFKDTTRNFRRNNDNLANPLPKGNGREIDDNRYVVGRLVNLYRGTFGDETGCLMVNDISPQQSTVGQTCIQSDISNGEILYFVPEYAPITASVVNDELVIEI